MRRSLRTLSFALALSSCGAPSGDRARAFHGRGPVVRPMAPAADEPAPPVDIPKILDAVVRVRGLEPLREVPIVALDDAAFDDAFREANGLAKGDKPRAATTDPRFFDGYYTYASRSIIVRKKPLAKQGDPRVVLAHELVHALQHQHFDTDKLKAAVRSADEQMALKALLEGDAQLSAIGAVADLDGVPPQRAMIMTSALRADEDASLQVGSDVAALPYGERTRLIFPYLDGERFVGVVYRAGGFGLVNRLYEQPPKTTSFIAHPDVYLAGVPVVQVPPLLFPKESKVERVQGTRMGELGLRALLVDQGSQEGPAEKLSASWRGDWLGVGTRADGREAVAGLVVFSNEEDAEVARQIVKGSRRGRAVAFAEGMPATAALTAQRDALDSPIPDPPASPPFGTIVIPPAPVPLERQARFGGVYDGQSFVDPGVGLRLKVGGAYRVVINGDALLSVSDGHSTMGVVLFDFGQSPISRAQTKAQILNAASKIGVVVSYADASVNSPLGPAFERSVHLADGKLLSAVIMPMCAGRATMVMLRLGYQADPFATAASVQLPDWINSLDAPSIEQSDFCTAISSEWQPHPPQ